MKIKLSDIKEISYTIGFGGNSAPIMFNCDDVKRAISENRFDERSFQGDYESLNAELYGKTLFEAQQISTKQHVERISALCINNRWNQPILIYKEIDPKVDILDGGHRVWAAKCSGESEIEAIVVDIDPKFTGVHNGKQALWDEVSKQNGDIEGALKVLGIKYSM